MFMLTKIVGIIIIVKFTVVHGYGHQQHKINKLKEVFAWKQLTFNLDGQIYDNLPRDGFNQYNNVPNGFEVYKDKVFVTVPRRQHGIPSTLNYVDKSSSTKSPNLKPYPNAEYARRLVSVYRPRVDRCDRLWMVDTGLIEIPNARRQVQPPAVIIIDLKTDRELVRYPLKSSDLQDDKTPAGLTSITVEVNPEDCGTAFAYINDLATNGLIVFSLKDRDSWRIDHSSFAHNPSAVNFSVAGNVIPWKDGLFSITLGDFKPNGDRTAYYHPLVANQEFSVGTCALKTRIPSCNGDWMFVGERGANTQSGSHDYDPKTKNIFFANVAQDAILCWNTQKPLYPHNVEIVVQDHQKLVYISDLKVIGNEVWTLVNQITNFIYSALNTNKYNFYIHRSKIQDLISGTECQ